MRKIRSRRKSLEAEFDIAGMLKKVTKGKTLVEVKDGAAIYRQGEPCAGVYVLQQGKVKLTVVSKQGKEAVLAMIDPGQFFGEGALNGQPLRMSTATAVGPVVAACLERATMVRLMKQRHDFATFFTDYLLSRTLRVEEDLVDQLFNSSEKRLARILLLLAHFGNEGKTEHILPRVSQETLAAMVGTTRPRVNFFMNKFRKLGFLEYNDTLQVHSSLLSVVLAD